MARESLITKRGQGDFHQVYRPCRISEVYGQDEIKEVVRKGLDEGSLPHAMLFYGVSGTGKTTLGRIIAMGLNCRKGPTSEPCCDCESCFLTMHGSSLSFLEKNAADFTGVDHVRKLKSDFACSPFCGDNKRIYLFDECHGLTKEAQNALLKDVEDPMDHLHFIFCSTEPKKMIDTLRNRCIEFEFKEVPDETMWELLFDIVMEENFKPNEAIMQEIIKQVNGKPRNALNELQKAIAAGKFEKMSVPFEEIMKNAQERFEAIRKEAKKEEIKLTREE